MQDLSHRRSTLGLLFLLLPLVSSGCRSVGEKEQTQVRAHPNLIAHVEHNGVSFSVAVDSHDPSSLRLVIPERIGAALPLPERRVEIRVIMADDSRKEGLAKKLTPTLGMSGSANVNYLFPLGRKISVDDIHSVRVSIDGDSYEVCPF